MFHWTKVWCGKCHREFWFRFIAERHARKCWEAN